MGEFGHSEGKDLDFAPRDSVTTVWGQGSQIPHQHIQRLGEIALHVPHPTEQ